jgi:hypothetical protein
VIHEKYLHEIIFIGGGKVFSKNTTLIVARFKIPIHLLKLSKDFQILTFSIVIVRHMIVKVGTKVFLYCLFDHMCQRKKNHFSILIDICRYVLCMTYSHNNKPHRQGNKVVRYT